MKLSSFDQLSKTISFFENAKLEEKLKYLDELYGQVKELPFVCGVTGPPGVGKSTLINHFASSLAEIFGKVVVFAIDPSSHSCKGSFLGDRVRFVENPKVYFRSFSTRGLYGGVNEVILDSIALCGYANCPIVIVETAGVGQSEVVIREFSNFVLALLTPVTGDIIQGLKAGLLEVADYVAINRAELGQVDLFEKDIRVALGILGRSDVQIDRIDALSGKGVDTLVLVIQKLVKSFSPLQKSKLLNLRVCALIQGMVGSVLKDVSAIEHTSISAALRSFSGIFKKHLSNLEVII